MIKGALGLSRERWVKTISWEKYLQSEHKIIQGYTSTTNTHTGCTLCRSRHLMLFTYLRQNSQRKITGSVVSSWGYGEKYQGFMRNLPNSIMFIFFILVTTSSGPWPVLLPVGTWRLPVIWGVEGVSARGVDGLPSADSGYMYIDVWILLMG